MKYGALHFDFIIIIISCLLSFAITDNDKVNNMFSEFDIGGANVNDKNINNGDIGNNDKMPDNNMLGDKMPNDNMLGDKMPNDEIPGGLDKNDEGNKLKTVNLNPNKLDKLTKTDEKKKGFGENEEPRKGPLKVQDNKPKPIIDFNETPNKDDKEGRDMKKNNVGDNINLPDIPKERKEMDNVRKDEKIINNNPEPMRGGPPDEVEPETRPQRIPMNCIKEHKVYCSKKLPGFKFNDGCHNCECKSEKDGLYSCGTGPCKYYVRSFTEAVDYCAKIENENKMAYDAQKETLEAAAAAASALAAQKSKSTILPINKTLKPLTASSNNNTNSTDEKIHFQDLKNKFNDLAKITNITKLNQLFNNTDTNSNNTETQILEKKLAHLSTKQLLRTCIYRIAYNELTVRRIEHKIHFNKPKGKLFRLYINRLNEIKIFNEKTKHKIIEAVHNERMNNHHRYGGDNKKYSRKHINFKEILIKLQEINNELRDMKSGIRVWAKKYSDRLNINTNNKGPRRFHHRPLFRRKHHRFWKGSNSLMCSWSILIFVIFVTKLIV